MVGWSQRQARLAAVWLILAACGALPCCEGGVLSGDRGGQTGGRGGGGAVGGGSAIGGPGVGGSLGTECGSVGHTTWAVPVDVLIVLDASASMNDDASGGACSGGCGASSKWALTAAAIERLVADTESMVNWGLKIFPEPGSVCGTGAGVAVPVGPARAAAIAAAIGQRTSPNGGVIAGGNAPIRDAMNGATAYLAGLTDAGRKSILLATAGAPNCVPGIADTGAEDSRGSILAVTSAVGAGFPTTVVGIATPGGMADLTLGQMALAGGYPNNAGPPPYTPVADVGSLTSPLQSLLGVDPPCVFSVPLPPNNDGTTSRSNIVVRLDDVDVPRDASHMNGWDYNDANLTSIQLYGPACEVVQSAPPHTVSIIFRCWLG